MNKNKLPKLSVVICTVKNRRDKVVLCLKGLTKQGEKNFEVIIVEGGSGNGPNTVYKKFAKSLGLKSMRTKKQNLPHQRNLGIAEARSSIVAFIDDDAVPTNDWTQNIIKSFTRNKQTVVLGGKILSVSKDYISKFTEALFDYGPKRKAVSVVTGVNSAFNLKRLKKLNLRKKIFDERYIIAGDDTEACFYIKTKGGEIIYDPSIVVRHYFRTNLVKFIRRQFDYAHADLVASTKPSYRPYSLVEDYLSPLNRKLTILLLPLLLPIIVFKLSARFVLWRGLVWAPLILIREASYIIGVYITLLQKAAGRVYYYEL